MCSVSVLTRELNTREQSQVSTTQSIISASNQPNLTGPKLPFAARITGVLIVTGSSSDDEFPVDWTKKSPIFPI
jgi:hypothetical protein